jgi:hypothetical protein
MVAALGTGFPVTPALLLGEDPLPRPFTLRDWILLRAKEMGGLTARPMAVHEVPPVALPPSHPSPVAAQQPEPPSSSQRFVADGLNLLDGSGGDSRRGLYLPHGSKEPRAVCLTKDLILRLPQGFESMFRSVRE